MQTKLLTIAIVSGLAAGMFALAPTASAAATSPQNSSQMSNSASANNISCHMNFTLSGWSVIYKTSTGHGMIKCSNGKSMKVHLSAKGGGLTVGHYKIADGHGHFTGLSRINQVLGTYIKAEAHAGAVNSAHAVAMTKGNVSLALAGKGNGWNIGAAITGFTISRASAHNNGSNNNNGY